VKTFLVFGNPDIADDSEAVHVAEHLREDFPDIEFRKVDPNELDVWTGDELLVLDVVQGLTKPRWVEMEEIEKAGKQATTHDFDAGIYLMLMKKMRPDISIRILGIPQVGDHDTMLQDIATLLRSM
jgi:Ni,Fe-hydrogenase maturation factor